MKSRIFFGILVMLLLFCFLPNYTYLSSESIDVFLRFDLSGLPTISFNGVTEIFIPETEGGGPGGCVAIITDKAPTKATRVSYQYYIA